MSNWKHAYGWSGHILVPDFETNGNPDENVVAIPSKIYARIAVDADLVKLDERIEARVLGIRDHATMLPNALAVGTCFSEGFTHYGTVFAEAEARAVPGPPVIDYDSEYLSAMKEIYGLDLPPCRLMIGCSSEH